VSSCSSFGGSAERQQAAEKLRFDKKREGHEFTRATKSLKIDSRFSA